MYLLICIILVYFILFWIYFDTRINILKKELVDHYRIFEQLLVDNRIEKYSSLHEKVDPYHVNSFSPTQQETRNGLESIKRLKGGIDWFEGFSPHQESYALVNF